MAKIELNGGLIAIVDDEDFEWLNKKHWRMHSSGYVCWGRQMLMHREIMMAKKGFDVDHKNMDKLDNRKSNLRICSRSQNNYNSPGRVGRISKYKGVLPNKKRWAAQIQVKGKTIHLGTFDTQEQAALMYNSAAIKYAGEFAFLNEVA